MNDVVAMYCKRLHLVHPKSGYRHLYWLVLTILVVSLSSYKQVQMLILMITEGTLEKMGIKEKLYIILKKYTIDLQKQLIKDLATLMSNSTLLSYFNKHIHNYIEYFTYRRNS